MRALSLKRWMVTGVLALSVAMAGAAALAPQAAHAWWGQGFVHTFWFANPSGSDLYRTYLNERQACAYAGGAFANLEFYRVDQFSLFGFTWVEYESVCTPAQYPGW
jgi:hypothetical protein